LEFSSSPRSGHPLFTAYIEAALAHKRAGQVHTLSQAA